MNLNKVSLEARHISLSYGPVEVLKDVNIRIEPGEFFALLGPSGSGKSTLLRLIAGLEDITSGELVIGDEIVNDLPPSERGISMVFQSYALYPHMTVRENLAFPLDVRKVPLDEQKKEVDRVAKILELDTPRVTIEARMKTPRLNWAGATPCAAPRAARGRGPRGSRPPGRRPPRAAASARPRSRHRAPRPWPPASRPECACVRRPRRSASVAPRARRPPSTSR